MIVSKYRWYYEYLQALVKVKHPKEHVDLYIKQNDDCFLAGQYYIDKKTKTLLSSKRGQLKKLQNTKYSDDLFGSVEMKIESKMATLESEISDLEKGIFNYWYPPTYINLIKQYI